MPAEAPRAVLSEHFNELMQGKRLVSAVFLTFTFEPSFFELQVLPVFFDTALSHAERLRTFQLEEALRTVRGHIAVYYDANGLIPGSGSAKLDIRRIPVRRKNGAIFHPKNVFLLVEDKDQPEDGEDPARTLLVASLSANLTESGWWRNVEVCHVEVIAEGARTSLKEDLRKFLSELRAMCGDGRENDHAALEDIRTFLAKTDSRENASTGGRLHPRFFGGKGDFVDFLRDATGSRLRGLSLEVISPFLDDAPTSKPLEALIDAFAPPKVRVYLPRDADDRAVCRQELYDSVRKLDGVGWGRLPKALLRSGQGNETKQRGVHAKVYRFFSAEREILFVGSANLTSAAHRQGGNLETGFVVEVPNPKDDFWLAEDRERPAAFDGQVGDEAPAASGGTKLDLRYHWDHARAEACWNGAAASPELRLVGGGIEVGVVASLPPKEWTVLPDGFAKSLADHLATRSLFDVHGEEAEPTLLLVQEEGMAQKPSLLFSLSAAEILRYWALLTPEQRNAFLETHAPALKGTEEGAALVARHQLATSEETFFSRFAGVFHAFNCLERAVTTSLEGDGREARYRLFGKKYDSLGTLLECVLRKEEDADPVVAYVTVLCAKQLCDEVRRNRPEFWKLPENDSAALVALLEERHKLRARLLESNRDEMGPFLDWFDDEFLKKAKPLAEVTA